MNPYIQDELFQKPENDEEERGGKSEEPELEIPEETEDMGQVFLPGLKPKKSFDFFEAHQKAPKGEKEGGKNENPQGRESGDNEDSHYTSASGAAGKYE